MPRTVRTIALIGGVILVFAGLFGIGIYAAGVIEIVVEQPPDRSWLFWGLIFLLGGLTCLGGGIGLIYAWRAMGRAESTSA